MTPTDVGRTSVLGVIEDAFELIALVISVPIAILLVGSPIALLGRLLLAIVHRF